MIQDITLVLLHLENPIIILYLLCIYLVYESVESAGFRFNVMAGKMYGVEYLRPIVINLTQKEQ